MCEEVSNCLNAPKAEHLKPKCRIPTVIISYYYDHNDKVGKRSSYVTLSILPGKKVILSKRAL